MKELISVIVPVYNTSKYLPRCIESIQRQTYTNLQIILVDDGSVDGSSAMCDEISKKDNRVTVIHKENAGQGLARNDGLDIACGVYVTFVDSDDSLSEDHVFNLYKALKLHEADIALGNHIWVSVSGEHTSKMLSLQEGSYQNSRLRNEIVLPLIGADVHDKTDVLINSSVSMNLYRMEIIKNNGIEFISERKAVAEDFYFNLDFLHYAKKAVFCKENGYFYYQNTESTCNKYNPKRFERTICFYELTNQRVDMYNLHDSVGWRVERSFLMKLRVAIRHVVMSNLTRKEKIEQIKEYLSDSTVVEVLKKYPISTYPFSLRLLTVIMKKRFIIGVYCLMLVREKSMANTQLRKITHFLGLKR